jgi:hypothetical protein
LEPIYIWVHICRKLIWICLNLHPECIMGNFRFLVLGF